MPKVVFCKWCARKHFNRDGEQTCSPSCGQLYAAHRKRQEAQAMRLAEVERHEKWMQQEIEAGRVTVVRAK